MKRQIFLDLDGPILDNRDKYFGLVTSLLKGGVGSLTRDSYWDMKRARMKERDILAGLSLDDEAMTAYETARIARIEDFETLKMDKVWPWIPEILSTWRRDSELFIVTMRKRRETLLQELDYLGLTSHFDHILSRDGNTGDAPVKVELVRPLRRDVPGFFVGDTEADIRAGKSLGLRTFGVTCGIRNLEQLEKETPDAIIADLREMPGLVERYS